MAASSTAPCRASSSDDVEAAYAHPRQPPAVQKRLRSRASICVGSLHFDDEWTDVRTVLAHASDTLGGRRESSHSRITLPACGFAARRSRPWRGHQGVACGRRTSGPGMLTVRTGQLDCAIKRGVPHRVHMTMPTLHVVSRRGGQHSQQREGTPELALERTRVGFLRRP